MINEAPRRPWNRRFDTAEDLYDKMIEYLDDIRLHNANRIVYIDMTTGEEYKTLEQAINMGAIEEDVKAEVIKIEPHQKKYPTIYGFAAFANMGTSTLNSYAKRDPEFEAVVMWFKNVLQADLEQVLMNPTTRNTNGPKFVAVNNYGWTDKSEVSHQGAQPVTFIDDLDDN